MTAGTIVGGFLIAWGRITQRVNDQGEHQKKTNGKVEKQHEKEVSLDKEIQAIKSRCETRGSLWRRNNEDHIELFTRINSLEKGLAALPGQVSEMIDSKLEQWRKHMRTDLRATIQELGDERRKQRQATNSTNKEDE